MWRPRSVCVCEMCVHCESHVFPVPSLLDSLTHRLCLPGASREVACTLPAFLLFHSNQGGYKAVLQRYLDSLPTELSTSIESLCECVKPCRRSSATVSFER